MEPIECGICGRVVEKDNSYNCLLCGIFYCFDCMINSTTVCPDCIISG